MMLRLLFGLSVIAGPVLADQHPEAGRVLSIGGAVTEIVHVLGQQDRLVARDSTSSFPPSVEALPDVGYIRALSAEGVLSVEPDLILAEEGAGPPEVVALLRDSGIPYETIPGGTDADGLAAKIEAVAEALGVPEAASEPVAKLRADLQAAAEAAQRQDPARVMFILSVQGGRIMASGTGTEADAMINLAGAINAIDAFEGYKPVTDEAILAAAPDVILMMLRGEASASHGAPDDQLFSLPALAPTPAARDRRVIRMDGLYLLGFGPRTGKAARDLHDAIYGEAHGRD